MPTVQNPTPHFWRTEGGVLTPDGSVWAGPIWEMVLSWQQTYGVVLQPVELSAEAIARGSTSNSTWWGCIYQAAAPRTAPFTSHDQHQLASLLLGRAQPDGRVHRRLLGDAGESEG